MGEKTTLLGSDISLPKQGTFEDEDDVPFSKVGHVSSLEGRGFATIEGGIEVLAVDFSRMQEPSKINLISRWFNPSPY